VLETRKLELGENTPLIITKTFADNGKKRLEKNDANRIKIPLNSASLAKNN
jgi:hypothetical protein